MFNKLDYQSKNTVESVAREIEEARAQNIPVSKELRQKFINIMYRSKVGELYLTSEGTNAYLDMIDYAPHIENYDDMNTFMTETLYKRSGESVTFKYYIDDKKVKMYVVGYKKLIPYLKHFSIYSSIIGVIDVDSDKMIRISDPLFRLLFNKHFIQNGWGSYKPSSTMLKTHATYLRSWSNAKRLHQEYSTRYCMDT